MVHQYYAARRTTGALDSSIDSDAGADIRGLAVHPGTSQIVMCSAQSVKLLETIAPTGTSVFSRTVADEAWRSTRSNDFKFGRNQSIVLLSALALLLEGKQNKSLLKQGTTAVVK